VSEDRWGIIGFGEVGSTFARHLSDRIAHPVLVADPVFRQDPPAPQLQERLRGIRISKAENIERLVAGVDIVISTVTVRVAGEVAAEASRTFGRGLFVDLNSSEPGSKQATAASFPADSYVDGAILGAIQGEGAGTPIALAGPRAGEALEAFRSVGFRASVTGERVGGASALKLCRSVFMKGLECLFVETLLAAREYDLQQPVLETIEQTLTTYGLAPMADMLVKTHARHCGRRAREMDGAVRMLEEMRLPAPMSQASRILLDASSESGLVEHCARSGPLSLEEVLDYLASHYRGRES